MDSISLTAVVALVVIMLLGLVSAKVLVPLLRRKYHLEIEQRTIDLATRLARESVLGTEQWRKRLSAEGKPPTTAEMAEHAAEAFFASATEHALDVGDARTAQLIESQVAAVRLESGPAK